MKYTKSLIKAYIYVNLTKVTESYVWNFVKANFT